MEFYHRCIELVDANLIYCLIPIILTLFLVELFFKYRFETKKALNLFRWIIIVYTLCTGAIILFELVIKPDDSYFFNRATGRYKVAFWIMFLSATILPLTLFIKKLASKIWYVLLVAFAMKIGFYFERFVILTTSQQRDFMTENAEVTNALPRGLGMLMIQGVIIALLTLGIFEVVKRKNKASF